MCVPNSVWGFLCAFIVLPGYKQSVDHYTTCIVFHIKVCNQVARADL